MMSPRRLALATALLVWWCPPLHAQGAWDAILNIDPYPSPYYSDWDVDPNIATLTVINTTAQAQQVRIHFNVSNRANQIVLSGSSDPQDIGAGATVIFDNPYDVAGTTHRDAEEEEIASRTGRLREGDYTACAVVADLTGFSLAESCADFTIVYPDPPLLIGPDNRDYVAQPDPLFQWTPVQVPVDFQLNYVVRIVEVLRGQTAQEALRSNIPHFQSLDEQFPSLRYPIDARPFEAGRQYAWTVQVLDQNGYAAAANDGRSEIWTFRYGDEPTNENAGDQSVRVMFVNADAADTTTQSAPELQEYTSEWDDICADWSTVSDLALKINVNGKYAFPKRIALNDARLVRADTVHGTYGKRQWVIYGTDPDTDSMMLLSGDCWGWNNEQTRRRWLGRRPAADAEELAGWIPTGTPEEHTDPVAKLKFGVRIISWFEEEAGKDALAPVKAFLEDREVEIKTGLNFFGVLDARETAMWTVLGLLPYDDGPAEIELAGFFGANVEVEGTLSWSSKDGVEAGAEAEAEVLTLRAMLPEHRLPYELIKTLRLGLEISLGATAEMEHISKPTEVGVGGQVGAKLIVELEDKNDMKWTGEVEVPFAVKRADGRSELEFEPTLTLKADTAWQPFKDFDFKFGNPEFELKFTRNFSNTDQSSGVEIEGTLKAAAILGGEEVGSVGASLGRAYDARSEKLVDLAKETLKASEAALAKAKASGDSTEIARQEKLVAKSKSLLARNEKAKELEDAELKKSSIQQGYKQPMVGKTYFKATIGLGDMSLSKIVDLFQKIRLAAQP